MRTILCPLAAGLAVLGFWLPANPARADPKPDDGRDTLTGKWQVVAWEMDGQKLPVLFSQVVQLDVKSGSYRLDLAAGLAGWSEHRGTFKIVGVEKGVFQVDLEYTNTAPVGESNTTAQGRHTVKAIWELVGKDELRVCRTEKKDRPDKFETKDGDGRVVEVYKRKKP
jgi:uncharacterized protein (TIGR03067 family)